jgi:hypothetical protein
VSQDGQGRGCHLPGGVIVAGADAAEALQRRCAVRVLIVAVADGLAGWAVSRVAMPVPLGNIPT